MAVDRLDHRHLAVQQRADHGLHALAVIGAGGIGLVEHADAGAVLHAFPVPAGAERLAAAGQDDRADAAVAAEDAPRVADVLAVGLSADRIPAFGLDPRQDRALAPPLDTQKYAPAKNSIAVSKG